MQVIDVATVAHRAQQQEACARDIARHQERSYWAPVPQNVNGYVSSGKQKLHQARPGGYVLAFDDNSLNAGVGVNGKATEKLRLGGLLSFVSNTDSYSQGLDVFATPANAAT